MRTEPNYRDVPWPVVESGLWLRAGMLSAGASVLAVVTIVTTASAGLIALAWAIAAAVFGYVALRRAWSLLDEEDGKLKAAHAHRAMAAPHAERAALLHG
jgi:hypothetical protein